MKKNKKLFAFMLAGVLLFAFTCSAFAAETTKNYPDVPASHWAAANVQKLTQLGGIEGQPDGKFYPNDTITRAEFVKIVVACTLGEQEKNQDTHWAESYFAKAEDSGILEVGEFSRDTWNDSMKRQDMAKVITRTMEKVKKETPVADTTTYTAKITDWATTCETCKPYIAQAYAKGILNGLPDGSFAGTATATRAEATAVITRLLDPSLRVTGQENKTVGLNDYQQNNMGIDKIKDGTPTNGFEDPKNTTYTANANLKDLPLTVSIDSSTAKLLSVDITSDSITTKQEKTLALSIGGLSLIGPNGKIWGAGVGGEYDTNGKYYDFGVPVENGKSVVAINKYPLAGVTLADYQYILLQTWSVVNGGESFNKENPSEYKNAEAYFIVFENPYYKGGK